MDDGEGTNVENDGAKVVKYSRKRKRRVYLLVAAVAVLALAAGMTSIGGAPFVAKIRKQLIGEREMVKVNSEREGEDERLSTESAEESFYQGVEDIFGFSPARLEYMPQGTVFVEYEIDKMTDEACALYECDGKIMEYQIIPNFKERTLGYDIEDKLLEEEEMTISGQKININHYKIENNEDKYVAKFEYKGTLYIFNATTSEQIFNNIIKNIFFP